MAEFLPYRLRVQYVKSDRLRYLSHLELIHSQERVIRRADIPYAVTQGFSPHMKVAFGPALGCGTAGMEEFLDVYMMEQVPAEEVLKRLQTSSVADLMPVDAWYVDFHEPSLVTHLNVLHYQVTLGGYTLEELQKALEAVIAKGSIEVVRKKKSKELIIADLLYKAPELVVDGERVMLDMYVRNDENGTMRPEILLGAMSEQLATPIEVLEMVRVEQLHDDGEKLVHLCELK